MGTTTEIGVHNFRPAGDRFQLNSFIFYQFDVTFQQLIQRFVSQIGDFVQMRIRNHVIVIVALIDGQFIGNLRECSIIVVDN